MEATSNFFGEATHLHVMSELLLCGFNVAIPQVDTGDDIFVVHNQDGGGFIRIQVKGAHLKPYKYDKGKGLKCEATFTVPSRQLKNPPPTTGGLVYIFVVRDESSSLWLPPCILSYDTLSMLYKNNSTALAPKVTFNFVFETNKWETTATCLKTKFSKFISPKRYSKIFSLNEEELV